MANLLKPKAPKVIISHGWHNRPDHGWLEWLAAELRARGVEVIAPAFPNRHVPKLENWLGVLDEMAGVINRRTVLVGYSLGTPTTLRFLSNYPVDVRVAGVILIAGFGEDPRVWPNKLLDPPIDYGKVKRRARRRICIYSDNDKVVFPAKSRETAKRLDAEEIVVHGGGHFLDWGRRGLKEFPAALDAVLGCLGMQELPVQAGVWGRLRGALKRVGIQ